MKKRLLFTGGGGSASQAIWEQWRERYELYFADANPSGFPPAIPAERRVVIPFARAPSFTESMREICARLKIDLLIPGVDEELPALSRMRGAPGWPQILTPQDWFVDLMLDKLKTSETLRGAGLDGPVTLPLSRAAEIAFPLIAKPRSGRGSRGVMKLDRLEQAAAYLTLQSGPPEAYVAQELGLGDEYTVFVAADAQARLRAVAPVHAFEKRGVTIRAETALPTPILDYVRRFQEALKPVGVYNIQCMLTPEGRVLPFEVNPRVSTTFVLVIATGYDPVPMALGEDDTADVFSPQGVWSLQRSWLSTITKVS